MKKIFISRRLEANSLFKQLEKTKYTLIDESLISFKEINFDYSGNHDWIVFYSKSGIKYFFKNHHTELNMKVAVMGTSSAEYLKETSGIQASFIFDKYNFPIVEFDRLTATQSILFIRGKTSLKRFQNSLSLGQRIDQLIVYDNKARTDFEIPPCDILIFTSPLNVKTYFNQFNYSKDQKVICIGPTTGNCYTSLIGETPIIAKTANERGLYEAFIKLNPF